MLWKKWLTIFMLICGKNNKEMKHLRLFESFDKYDFKKYTVENGDDLSYILDSLDSKDISDEDVVEIRKILPGARMYTNKYTVFYLKFFENDDINAKYCYNIYYLGDYCYALLCIDVQSSKHIYIQVFDEIDSLLAELENFKFL